MLGVIKTFIFVIFIFTFLACSSSINLSKDSKDFIAKKLDLQTLEKDGRIELNSLKAINLANKDNKNNLDSIFKDKLLIDLILKGIQNNTDLLILQENILRAKINVKGVISKLFPSDNINLASNQNSQSFNTFQTTITQNTLNLNASFSYEVDIFGKNSYDLLSKNELIKYAILNYRAMQVNLISQIATNYYILQSLHMQMPLLESMQEVYENLAKIKLEEYNLKLIDLRELVNVTNNITLTKNKIQELRQSIRVTKSTLEVLIQDKVEERLESSFLVNIPLLSQMPLDSILSRPDVKANIFNLNANLYGVKSKKRALLPSLRINGSLGQILASSSGLDRFIWQVASQLLTPLLNRQALYNDLNLQRSITKESFLSLKLTISKALEEINNQIILVDSTNTILQNLELNNKSYEQILLQAKEQFKNGLIDIAVLSNDKINLINSQISLINAKSLNAQAKVKLYVAFGDIDIKDENLNKDNQAPSSINKKELNKLIN